MSTYLITGGTGLVGNYVVKQLASRGLAETDIIAYDLCPNEEAIADIADDVTLVNGDITDSIRLMETFEEYEPDRVIHLGAYVAHKAWENPSRAIEINGVGTNNVFDAARVYDVATCLYASTGSVYGTVDDYCWKGDPVIVHETDTVKPQNPYAATKYLNEVMGRTYDEKHATSYVGVRIGGVWGLGRTAGATGGLNTFIREVGLGNDATVPTYWTNWKNINLSYGKDVGRWFVKIVNKDRFNHQVYNQGNREPYRVERIVDTLNRLVPEATIEYPAPDNNEEWSGALTNPQLDCIRWYEDLGLEQRWSVEAAITDYINYHRQRRGIAKVRLPD